MQDKLRGLGADVTWIMTGLDREETNKKFSEMVTRISQQELTKGEMEIIAILRTLGIGETIDFNIYFDYARAVNDKMKRDSGKHVEYKRVAESPLPKYHKSKRKKGEGK
jgi:hypothetical protein